MMKAIGGIIGSIIVGVIIFDLTQGPPQWLVSYFHPVRTAHMSILQNNTDRPGGDYKDVPESDINECLTICVVETQCQAASYNASARQCWLKQSVPLKLIDTASRPRSSCLPDCLSAGVAPGLSPQFITKSRSGGW